MIASRCRHAALAALVALLGACASVPAPETPTLETPAPEAPAAMPETRAVVPDETTYLLNYQQSLQRMSAAELTRERAVLAATAPSPTAQVRLAMLLAQTRGAPDLPRALALLDAVLKSREPAAVSLQPLARALASNYQERLKLQMQNEKLAQQNEKIAQQLNDGLLRNVELQEKIDALTAIERSLPVRPAGGENPIGSPR